MEGFSLKLFTISSKSSGLIGVNVCCQVLERLDMLQSVDVRTAAMHLRNHVSRITPRCNIGLEFYALFYSFSTNVASCMLHLGSLTSELDILVLSEPTSAGYWGFTRNPYERFSGRDLVSRFVREKGFKF